MSIYSETIGSFVRTADYPLEANYFFDTEEELLEFYNEPINKVTLHKGLLKVVGNLDLYWVTEDLTFKKLLSIDSLETLNDLKDRLEKLEVKVEEIDKLLNLLQVKVATLFKFVKSIVGSDVEDVPEYLNTLSYGSITALSNALDILEEKHDKELEQLTKDLFDALHKLKTEHQHDSENFLKELDRTLLGVGLNGDGSYDLSNMLSTTYLSNTASVIEALKTLDREMTNLVVDAFIQDAYYDTDSEEIVLTFITKDEKTKVIRISMTNLIREWEPYNDHPTKVVEITREEVYGGGTDKLSADVRLSSNKYNILEKDGNTLLVKGVSDNIVYEGDITVKAKLDLLSEFDLKVQDLTYALQEEVSRAKNSEANLDTKIETVKSNIETTISTQISNLLDSLNNEINRSTLEDSDIRDKVSNLAIDIQSEITRANASEKLLSLRIDSLKDSIDSNFNSDEAVKKVVDELKLADITLQNNLDSEVLRATTAEKALDHRIDDIDDKIQTIKENVESNVESKISILQDALTSEVSRSTQEDIEIKNKLVELKSDLTLQTVDLITNVKDSVNDVKSEIDLHKLDYSNPHKVTKAQVGLDKVDNTTDYEKPISRDTQAALNELSIAISKKSNLDDLLNHILDHNNPHFVTKEQLGLSNVDNTSDLNKPISLVTLLALDKKAELKHTHTMSDIEDLENLPIIKGFINILADLPEEANGGDKYVLVTKIGEGLTRYTLCEYDGSDGTWKLKLLTTGGVASVIDGDVYKLNSSGLEKILDESDAKDIDDKIYNETKDLINDIDWEEDDRNDTNKKIRLKISYKDSDPKYIDIERARFLADAYSRPARLSDIDNGYASKIGEPVLVLVFTTNDYIVIPLAEMLNIYDPIDTNSIDMSISDWTGDSEDSYKISATIKLASIKDKETAVSIHVNEDTPDLGLYATLHTVDSNSITLNPSYGNDGLKKLKADLKLDNTLNNTDKSNIILSISDLGLSAQFIWAEYE